MEWPPNAEIGRRKGGDAKGETKLCRHQGRSPIPFWVVGGIDFPMSSWRAQDQKRATVCAKELTRKIPSNRRTGRFKIKTPSPLVLALTISQDGITYYQTRGLVFEILKNFPPNAKPLHDPGLANVVFHLIAREWKMILCSWPTTTTTTT